MPRVSDRPNPGHYLLRLVKNGPWVAAEIVHHEDGTWSCMLDGVWSGPASDPWTLPDLERIHWGGRESYASETAYRLAMRRYAEVHKPDDPAANPRRAIDPNILIPF